MDTQQLTEAAKEMNRAGVYFFIQHPCGGCVDLDCENVAAYLQDVAGFWANEWGMSRETAATYLLWHEDGCPCTGFTRSGRPCKIRGLHYHDDPKKFVDGVTNRCEHHVEYGLKK